jgi:hypothetical protein
MKKNRKQIKLEYVSWFSARGLKRLYAADHWQFNGRRKYSIDIWSTKDDRLLMRFYNRCVEADNYAYEIRGMKYSDIPEDQIGTEEWIPACVFKEFEKWMISEMPYFISMKEFFNDVK